MGGDHELDLEVIYMSNEDRYFEEEELKLIDDANEENGEVL